MAWTCYNKMTSVFSSIQVFWILLSCLQLFSGVILEKNHSQSLEVMFSRSECGREIFRHKFVKYDVPVFVLVRISVGCCMGLGIMD